MAGQVIMQGFLHRHIPVWLRRLVTMVPSLIVIVIGLDPTRTLVISQVVLSFGLPFAVIPLVMFTRRRDLMGALVNSRITTALVILVAAFIVVLNLFSALSDLFRGVKRCSSNFWSRWMALAWPKQRFPLRPFWRKNWRPR